MADQQQEARIRQSNQGTWNGWRTSNPDVHIDLKGAQLDGLQLQFFDLRGADLRGASFLRANLHGAMFHDADLRGADLQEALGEEAQFVGAKLQRTNLSRARLADANFTGAQFDATKVALLQYQDSHRPMLDGTDAIVLTGRDRFNWGAIRRAGSLPLFELSYVALTASLLMITTVGYLNSTEIIQYFEYPIPLPGRVMWLLVSSFMLFVGTTMYRMRCPDRIQEFSETQWVEQHARPRLQYFAESWKRPWQVPTSLFLGFGGVAAALLLLERVWVATWYVIEELIRQGVL